LRRFHHNKDIEMNRRDFHARCAAAAAALLPGCAFPARFPSGDWDAIEQASGGRLGVAVLQQDGSIAGHRLDERFPTCSTFKWLAGACVLHRVDQGLERLDRRVVYGREALVPYAPITEKHVGQGMTVGELCDAAITLSDNPAGNLLLASFGGPQGLTAYARSLGDDTSRFDRQEPALNEATPGDPRDTSTPRAMTKLLHATLVGDALSRDGRGQLARWMEACQTDGRRLRAGLPAGWRLGSKTGSGGRGSSNDVGVFWPPGRPPIVVAVFLTDTKAADSERDAAIAAVARRVTGA
jgi:beta-lactamase class A